MIKPIPWCTCGPNGTMSRCGEPKRSCARCGFREVVRDKRLKQIREEGLTLKENGLRGLIIRKDED